MANLIWIILLAAVKNIVSDRWSRRINVLDLTLPLTVCGLHFLSQEIMGLSLVPFIIFAMALFGIAMTLTYAFLEGDIIYSAFFVRYIRIAGIVVLATYILFLLVKIYLVLTSR